MEIDEGSAVTLMSERNYKKLLSENKLQNTEIKLNFYNGEKCIPIGVLNKMNIEYGTITGTGSRQTGKPLIGRDWLNKLGLWPLEIKQSENKVLKRKKLEITTRDEKVMEKNLGEIRKEVFKKYDKLFFPGFGTYKNTQFKIKMRENVTPIYHKARQVPFALKKKVEIEIDRLIKEKILKPVELSELGTPVVPIIKPDEAVRLCGDYKITVNPNIVIDRHPIPKISHLIAKMQGGEYFTKIDLREAYMQVCVDKESRNYLTLRTIKGLMRPMKLPYGIASAPGFFQREIEQIFDKVEGIAIFLDDINIKGNSIS